MPKPFTRATSTRPPLRRPLWWRCLLLIGIPLFAAVSPAAAKSADPSAEDHFESRVRPLLAKHCWKCHGPDKAESGLRLDSAGGIERGGALGPAVAAGKPDDSLLIRAVRQSGELKMPPPPDGKLNAQQIDDLRLWIKTGAKWPPSKVTQLSAGASGSPFTEAHRRHWAFQPVRVTPPPTVRDAAWVRAPIDRWILAKIESQGARPAPSADKRTLLRRLTFDVIGLPPTPEEMADFLGDEWPGAFGNAVERLLASPQYGERWGRHWMDVVRYADTAGDNADYPVPEARLYRDYIIDALNADKPYDQFVREQLAGDILAGEMARNDRPLDDAQRQLYAEDVVATGFLALSRRYATAPFELMHLTLEDTIDTTGRAFLGLVLRCARCHDHKYDPITRQDYYALYGIFASTRFPYAGSEEFASKQCPRTGFVPLVSPAESAARLEAERRQITEEKREIQQIEQALESLKATPKKSSAQEDASRRAAIEQRLGALRSALRLREKWGSPADLPVAYAVSDDKAADQPIQMRGEPDQSGPIVPRGMPRFFAESSAVRIPAGASGRLQLAEWLTRPDHPLTARVMVNRIWQHHFGQGLVGTPSNLGLRGEPPTHPELLDYLADYFVRHGWSIKAMHRLILNSATWQQASTAASPEDASRYAGFARRRLDAEAIRDAMMSVAGSLRLDRPGQHPFPGFPAWSWTQHSPFKAVYDSPHRSVYLMRQRIQRHPYLALFDAPDANVSTDVRTSATVPLQALYLLNDPFVREQASSLAQRVLRATTSEHERQRLACELAWSRPPSTEEMRRGQEYLRHCGAELQRSGASAARAQQEAWSSYARILLTANEFFYVD